MLGVDKTQSIALDEIFGKKLVDVNGNERDTKIYRKTRVTTTQMTVAAKVDDELRKSINEIEGSDGKLKVDGESELVVLPTTVTRSEGLC